MSILLIKNYMTSSSKQEDSGEESSGSSASSKFRVSKPNKRQKIVPVPSEDNEQSVNGTPADALEKPSQILVKEEWNKPEESSRPPSASNVPETSNRIKSVRANFEKGKHKTTEEASQREKGALVPARADLLASSMPADRATTSSVQGTTNWQQVPITSHKRKVVEGRENETILSLPEGWNVPKSTYFSTFDVDSIRQANELLYSEGAQRQLSVWSDEELKGFFHSFLLQSNNMATHLFRRIDHLKDQVTTGEDNLAAALFELDDARARMTKQSEEHPNDREILRNVLKLKDMKVKDLERRLKAQELEIKDYPLKIQEAEARGAWIYHQSEDFRNKLNCAKGEGYLEGFNAYPSSDAFKAEMEKVRRKAAKDSRAEVTSYIEAILQYIKSESIGEVVKNVFRDAMKKLAFEFARNPNFAVTLLKDTH